MKSKLPQKTRCPPEAHLLQTAVNDGLRPREMPQGSVPVKLPCPPLLSEKPESVQRGAPTSDCTQCTFSRAWAQGWETSDARALPLLSLSARCQSRPGSPILPGLALIPEAPLSSWQGTHPSNGYHLLRSSLSPTKLSSGISSKVS